MRGKWITYSDDELRFIQSCKELTRKELTELFNKTFNRSLSKENIAALCKRNGWLTGRSGQFEKGASPWNTGKSIPAAGRSEETQFKKGNRPHNHVAIGTEIVTKDGYLKRKIKDDAQTGMSRKNWKFVHIIKWEEYHGKKVPPGHMVRFNDGDLRNFDKDNLVLLSRKENGIINKFFAMSDLPPGGTTILVALARLKMLATKRQRDRKNKGGRS
ncbi:HNH endonuclease [Hahella sp. KA22]|uniref:HNH endonuclease signature motif containing protein n=1 Tax=Hahella sp. KA22 TaxID=1628392 RepID=UPI000FDE3381|nr:HNH endonuclease signature motif containing protein [Hahella sp. KA22]AZZ92785.1 HNH endonuclease [Hahella sp. KA22]QAY56159.1 HNH endonuclease [Hahella sp. KA22]